LNSGERLRTELLRYFSTLNNREPSITRIEYEGARISIYTKNPELFADRDRVARELVSLIKKRVVVRSDEEIRLPREQVEAKIHEAIPNGYRLIFDVPLGEVVIESSDPQVTSLEGGEVLRNLMKECRWVIRLMREPLMPSKTMERVKQYVYWNQEDKLEILRGIGEMVFRPQIFDVKDVTLTVLGGGRQVGRSSLLLRTNDSTILLDCGLSPGAISPVDMYPRFDTMPDIIQKLDAVVVSHAHLDHVGLVPFLFKYGYRGPVYCVEPTLPLMALEQSDYISVAGKEGVFAPYTENEVRMAMKYTSTLKYGLVTNVTPDVRVTIYNAGHILGSGMVHIHVGEGVHNIVYSGDFKFEKSRALEASVYRFPRAETLIMESTYGATPVPYSREESEAIFADYVSSVLSKGGKVIIPVPAIGRAQEIMLVLNSLLAEKRIPETAIFLDGLVIEATALYTAFPDYLSAELQPRLKAGENVFLSEYFTSIKSPSQREEVLLSRGPAIIVSTSGMLEGGPILKYMRQFAADENNLLLFVSYQVEGTLGRKLLRGVREVTMTNEDGRSELLRVQMQIQKVDGFSGHSSRQQLINYLRRVTPKPRNVVLVHGEDEAIDSLAEAVSKMTEANIYGPRNLETIVLHQS